MATKHPPNTISSMRKEARDPSTEPERLGELARSYLPPVSRAAIRNPSLPEDVWREALMKGQPEAWANPMAMFYVLTWTPREDDWSTLEDVARDATWSLWQDPKRCSPEGKALLNAKMQEWWAASMHPVSMVQILGWWSQAKGDGSPEHREAVRILLLCVRTAPDLTAQDRQALDLLEAWSTGGEDRRKEAKDLPSSEAAKSACQFARNSSDTPWNAIQRMRETVERKAGVPARAEHDRLLADLIRQEMPLPPVVA